MKKYVVNYQTIILFSEFYQYGWTDDDFLHDKYGKAFDYLNKNCHGLCGANINLFCRILLKIGLNLSTFHNWYRNYQKACKYFDKNFTKEELRTVFEYIRNECDIDYKMIDYKYNKIKNKLF